MTAYAANDIVTAQGLRDRCFPQVSYVTVDQTVNASDVIRPVAGLTGELEGASYYAFDGVVFYSSNATADIKFTVQAPFAGVFTTAGAWSMFGIDSGEGSQPGDLNASFHDTLNTTEVLGLSGSAAALNVCLPRGWVLTRDSPGTVQWWFAQNTADASNTTVRAGSWIRFAKMGTR